MAASPQKKRVVFVDLLRLLATFQMVQGHSIDAVLFSDLRQGAAFGMWTWARGLTSVAFLFAAGMSFHLATLTRFEAHRSSPEAIRRRVRRGLLLVGIGYLLHNPLGALFTGEWGAALSHTAIVDVLQCIGVSILILEGLTLRLKTPRQVGLAAFVLMVVCVGLAPITESANAVGAGAWLTNYATHAGGSIFPLFPWAGYLFAGVVVGALACPGGRFDGRSVVWLAVLAALLVAGSWALRFAPYAEGAPDPAPGVLKLGVVVGSCALLAAASLNATRLPRVLTILAGETLVIYVVHIALLYGDGYGLADLVGPTLSMSGSVTVALAMVVGSALVGLGWRWLKDNRPWGPALARRLKAG